MVFFNLRPDSHSVWNKPEVKNRLSTYHGIIEGKKLPRFKLAKKLASNIKKTNDIELSTLWKEHRRLAPLFREKISQEQSISDDASFNDPKSTKYLSYLDIKIKIADKLLENCTLCAHRCEVNRKQGDLGFCSVGEKPILSSAFLHYGEESVLVPSGTIFFCGCNFHCQFCQNFSISQNFKETHEGREVSIEYLAVNADKLANKKAKNINWVGGDPNPNTAFILEALDYIKSNITQVWNSNFYMSRESMELLVDIMDVWLPDFKYWDNEFAQQMSKVKNYREVVTRNLLQAKNKGSNEIIIRHLVMPTRVEEDSIPILTWIKENVPKALVNIMSQYRPTHLIPQKKEYKHLNRGVTSKEMEKTYNKASKLDLLWRPVS